MRIKLYYISVTISALSLSLISISYHTIGQAQLEAVEQVTTNCVVTKFEGIEITDGEAHEQGPYRQTFKKGDQIQLKLIKRGAPGWRDFEVVFESDGDLITQYRFSEYSAADDILKGDNDILIHTNMPLDTTVRFDNDSFRGYNIASHSFLKKYERKKWEGLLAQNPYGLTMESSITAIHCDDTNGLIENYFNSLLEAIR